MGVNDMSAKSGIRQPGGLAEAFDRMLDRGIVIDAEIGLRIVGIAIASVEARIVIAGIETYLQFAEAIANTAPATWRAARVGDRRRRPRFELGRVPAHRLRPFLRDLEDDRP
jgi:hypothetical protein